MPEDESRSGVGRGLGREHIGLSILEKAVAMLNELRIPQRAARGVGSPYARSPLCVCRAGGCAGIQVIIAGAGVPPICRGCWRRKPLPVIGVPIPTEIFGDWIRCCPSSKCREAFRLPRWRSVGPKTQRSWRRSWGYNRRPSDSASKGSARHKHNACSTLKTTPGYLHPSR